MSRSKHQPPRYYTKYHSDDSQTIQASSQHKQSRGPSIGSKGRSDNQEAWTFDPSLSSLESISTSLRSRHLRKRPLNESDPLSKAQSSRDGLISRRLSTTPSKPVGLKRNIPRYGNSSITKLKLKRPVSRHGRNVHEDDESIEQKSISKVKKSSEDSQMLETSDESLSLSQSVVHCVNKIESDWYHSSELLHSWKLRHETASEKKSGCLSFPAKVTQDLRNRHRTSVEEISKSDASSLVTTLSSRKSGINVTTKENENFIEESQDEGETQLFLQDFRSEPISHRKKSASPKEFGNDLIETRETSTKITNVGNFFSSKVECTIPKAKEIVHKKIHVHDNTDAWSIKSPKECDDKLKSSRTDKGMKSTNVSSCRASLFSELTRLAFDNSFSEGVTKVISVDIPSRYLIGEGSTENSQFVNVSNEDKDQTSPRPPLSQTSQHSNFNAFLCDDSSASETPHLGICNSLDEDHYDRTTQMLMSVNRESLKIKDKSFSEILHQRCLELKGEKEGIKVPANNLSQFSSTNKLLKLSKANGSKKRKF
jgi:hypothetical protein